ncbi:MAG: S8 family serine peptidase [Actinomycetota bacterium]|nr:S8 family serine peptidase [Actinomycetota bacterium]
MAEAKVIAHFMHETEMNAATQRLHDVEVTESFVIGRIDDSQIAELEQQGLIVQRLDDEGGAETAARVRTATAEGPRVRTLGLRAAAPLPVAEVDESGANFYLLRLGGPLLEAWESQLAQLGVTLLERVPRASYTARLEPQQAHQVAALPIVETLGLYKPEDTGPVLLEAAIAPMAGVAGLDRPRAIQAFDIRLHREEDRPVIEAWLQADNVDIAGAGGRKIRFYALEEASILDEIAALPEVALVEPYVEPELFNDAARVLIGVDAVAGNPGSLGLEGEGQLVAVADTGLDDGHPDFAGRIDGLVALGRPPSDTTDPNGHGTHVAGSILGDGTASGGTVRGVAPKARLFFQSLLDPQGRLRGLPMNLGELFEPAYMAGARIHNNSWGAAVESAYTLNSEEVDEFAATHRDMLIVIAAGNEGQAANRFHSAQGFPDWLSIGAPATSKNALTVGASRSSRTSGGYSALTWGAAWPSEFPDPPVATGTVSGDPESLAGFSSRGPCDDRRIKPDVVAPGTDIASTKSSLAPLSSFWGPYPGAGGRYAYMGGTSMATPLVAGCAALVREYYVKNRQHQPSAALLKATLINGARWLTGADSIANQNAAPNYDQGFGAVHMPSTLPNEADPGLRLEFVDSWQDPQRQFNLSGQRFRYTVSVTGGSRLSLCLAYTDLPARGLQNDLNLVVQDPSGAKHVGNERLPERLTQLDRGNNVEVVRIDNPAAGDYLIQVSAFNLLRKGQDFALVVVGELASGLNPV